MVVWSRIQLEVKRVKRSMRLNPAPSARRSMKLFESIGYAALTVAAIVAYPYIRVLLRRGMRW
jgi:hypothetical protein